MELTDYRKQLDQIDDMLLQLFVQRMEISEKIATYKKEKRLPVLDSKREEEKLRSIRERCPDSEYAVSLFSGIMELSRSCQDRILNDASEIDCLDLKSAN